MSKFELSTSVDEGARVSDSDLAIRLYLSLKREVHWVPDLMRNGFHASSNIDDQDFLFSALDEQVTANIGRLHIVDSTEQPSIVDTIKMSLAELSESIIESAKAVDYIQEATRKAGLLTPSGRYFDLLVIRVTSDQLMRMCSVPVILESLQTLAEKGMDNRVPFLLVTDYAEKRHIPIIKYMNWAAYLGDDNVDFAESLYKNLEPGVFNPGRIKLGVLAAYDRPYLSVLQPLKYSPSAWGSMKKARESAEKQVYEDFLKGLQNGDN